MPRTNRDSLQATYLNDLRRQRLTVTVYLVTGLKQIGTLESFDQHALLLRHGGTMELIYKHMVASIMPAAKAQPELAAPSTKRAVKPSTPIATPVIIRKVPRRTIVREG
jgi:host factor-I protein